MGRTVSGLFAAVESPDNLPLKNIADEPCKTGGMVKIGHTGGASLDAA
jgi:hypothetical protein